MKWLNELESSDPERQRLYEVEGRKYRVVNLTLFPREADGSRATDEFPGLGRHLDFYRPHIWELAELPAGGGVEVMERFESLDDAIAAMTPLSAISEKFISHESLDLKPEVLEIKVIRKAQS